MDEANASDGDDSKRCFTRPCYRAGRKETSVAVYTVNQESRYLIVRNVPALGCINELVKLFALYGPIEEYRLLDEEECAPFTDVYWLKFVHISNARFAKRKLDDYKFLGNIIKVTYAPEQESPSETRAKLEERCRIVLRRMEKLEAERTAMSLHAAGCLPSSASATLNRSEWKHDAHFFPAFDSSVDCYPYEPTPLERLPRPLSDHAGSVSLYGPHRDPLIGPTTSAARPPVGVPTSAERSKDGRTSSGGTASQAKGTISQVKVMPKFIGPRKAPSSGAAQVGGRGPVAGSQLDARLSVLHPTTPEAPTQSITSIATDPKYYQSASMNETVLYIRQKLEAVANTGINQSPIAGYAGEMHTIAGSAGSTDKGKEKAAAQLQLPPPKKPRADGRRRI